MRPSFWRNLQSYATTGPCRDFANAIAEGKPMRDEAIRCVVGLTGKAVVLVTTAAIFNWLEERSKKS